MNKRVLLSGTMVVLAVALFISTSANVPPAGATLSEEVDLVEVINEVDHLRMVAAQPEDGSQECIDCHTLVTPKLVEMWQDSAHSASAEGATCLSCHQAETEDWDALDHNGFTVGAHPTPKDCSQCHEEEVTEFGRSKHGATSMIFFSRSFDRNVFEPTLATKHGCQQCHNIGHFWPDQSVGECDSCHAKHSFDVAVARNPYTCGECHLA